ncbi:MAG: carbonic anhydrase [Porphyromonadaceae bacterium CG2_30_38_12]|nr:MAG: carbonic anhydrase [Porphyromonadaceae bacterium CG2_30_38_12]
MQLLFDGVKKFNNIDFLEHKLLFEKISRNQQPHTLFIGCSDSRVVPSLITKTLPGDLFVIRNIANLVPPYRISDDFLAATSAIEYAVKMLEIKTILVCGHSNCGGCNALFMAPEALSNVPNTQKWLQLAAPVKEKILAMNITNVAQREWMTEQLNVVEQLNHLLTYPYIASLYSAGSIDILGWYYLIETGEVYNYDKTKKGFVKIE